MKFFSDGLNMKLIAMNLIFKIRYSIGIGVTWITALGPLSFAIASVFVILNIEQNHSNLKSELNSKKNKNFFYQKCKLHYFFN